MRNYVLVLHLDSLLDQTFNLLTQLLINCFLVIIEDLLHFVVIEQLIDLLLIDGLLVRTNLQYQYCHLTRQLIILLILPN